jgi:Protein of unknown function (DUF2934)
MGAYLHQRWEQPIVHEAEFNRKGDEDMSLAVADLQKQREEVRARLLANEAVRGRIAFRAYEIYQRRGDGHGGALNNWLQAEGEIVSSLVEQALQPDSESKGGKGLKGNLGDSPKARIKSGKKSQPRAASASDTASKSKARTKQATPTNAKSAKGKTNTSRTAKKPADASAKRKERSESESKLLA